jgi:hypothetical protein
VLEARTQTAAATRDADKVRSALQAELQERIEELDVLRSKLAGAEEDLRRVREEEVEGERRKTADSEARLAEALQRLEGAKEEVEREVREKEEALRRAVENVRRMEVEGTQRAQEMEGLHVALELERGRVLELEAGARQAEERVKEIDAMLEEERARARRAQEALREREGEVEGLKAERDVLQAGTSEAQVRQVYSVFFVPLDREETCVPSSLRKCVRFGCDSQKWALTLPSLMGPCRSFHRHCRVSYPIWGSGWRRWSRSCRRHGPRWSSCRRTTRRSPWTERSACPSIPPHQIWSFVEASMDKPLSLLCGE